MYRCSNGQISLSDFKQPVGMNLKESNRWVRKAQTIPWPEIEKRYAALFTNRKGNAAKPLRLALGACIIQAEYGYSDEETALQIQENPYLQYFCGYSGYDDEKLPFDPSLMVYFRKRLTPEVLGEINEMIVRDAKERQEKGTGSKGDDDSDDHPGTGSSRGTMIVDATCAPSNIRYPQDVSLLNEARENAEKLLDALHDPADGKKPRTYRKRARRDYLKYTRCRRHTAKTTRKAIGKQLSYLRRDLEAVNGKLSVGKILTARQTERLDTICTIYEQQKYMYDNHTHSVPDRIVSVSQPFVRPIVRGKAGKPVEFGAKLDISVVDGWTRLECYSFDAYNEAGNLKAMAERFREREGHYPALILADKIYRNRDNLSFCKEHGIRLSGPALGRPKKDEIRNKAQDYQDERERVEVERRFSLAKRKCGMGLVTAKLRETAAHVIAMSILVLNLRKIQRALLRLFACLDYFLAQGKMGHCSVVITLHKIRTSSLWREIFKEILYRTPLYLAGMSEGAYLLRKGRVKLPKWAVPTHLGRLDVPYGTNPQWRTALEAETVGFRCKKHQARARYLSRMYQRLPEFTHQPGAIRLRLVYNIRPCDLVSLQEKYDPSIKK